MQFVSNFFSMYLHCLAERGKNGGIRGKRSRFSIEKKSGLNDTETQIKPNSSRKKMTRKNEGGNYNCHFISKLVQKS